MKKIYFNEIEYFYTDINASLVITDKEAEQLKNGDIDMKELVTNYDYDFEIIIKREVFLDKWKYQLHKIEDIESQNVIDNKSSQKEVDTNTFEKEFKISNVDFMKAIIDYSIFELNEVVNGK